MSGEDTLTITTGFDLDVKAFTKTLAESSHATVVVEMLRPRPHWKAVAKALAKKERPHVRSLVLRALAFDPAGAVGRAMLSPKAGDSLWAALPGLEELELVGHAWATTLAHPTLRSLRMSGFGFTGSFTKKPADCPKLERLTWAFTGDELGVAPGVAAFKALWKAEGLPALRQLDFGGAELDGGLLDASSFVKSALLGQLESIVLPEESIDSLPNKLSKLEHVKRVGLANGSLPDTRVEEVAVEPMPLKLDRGGGVLTAFLVRDERIDALLAALEGQDEVRGLALASHSVSAEAGRLGEMLVKHPELRSLALDRPHIYGLEEAGIIGLAEGLGAHPGLERVNLRGNRLTGAGEPLMAWLQSLPALQAVDLDQTKPDESDLATMVAGVSACASLRELTIGGNADTEAAGVFASLESASLEQLGLWGLKAVPAAVAAELVGGFERRLPKLRTLRFSGYLDDEAAAAVTDALRGASLESLSIAVKGGLGGLAGIGDALASLAWLELESMDHDPVDAAGAEKLATILSGATALEHVTIEDWKLEKDAFGRVAEALAAHGSLRSVRGLGPKKALEGAELERFVGQIADTQIRSWAKLPYDMAEALVRANLAEDLSLESRKLDQWMADLPLSESTAITTLRLGGGMLEPATLKSLAEAGRDHPSLRKVVLKGAVDTDALFDFVEALEGSALETVSFDVWAPVAVVEAMEARTTDWSGPTLVL